MFSNEYFASSGIVLVDTLISQLDKLGIKLTSFSIKMLLSYTVWSDLLIAIGNSVNKSRQNPLRGHSQGTGMAIIMSSSHNYQIKFFN